MAYSGRWGQFHPPTIPVRIRTLDQSREVVADGVIDTGATLSVISPGVAEALDLHPWQLKLARTVSGNGLFPFHVVRIMLDTETAPLRPRGVLEAPIRGSRMLIGRDILQYSSLQMTPERFERRLCPT